MLLPALVRSVAVSSGLVGTLAAQCGFDPHGFGAVPVTIRSAQFDVCSGNDAESLARATAFYGWKATTPITQTADGFSITSHYALFVDPKQSHVDVVLPQGVQAAGAASVPYFCPLLGHELGHLEIASRFASSMHGSAHVSARTLVQAEDAMRTRVASVETAALARADREQTAYDDVTDHGFSQHLAGTIGSEISLRDIPACKTPPHE